jgi:aspartyl-tRNA synthetase
MGHSIEGMRDQFGALLDALEYGAPPHGGIAIGLDRWAALYAEVDNIREVMAFPKTQSGTDLMMGAPSPIDARQLDELHLRIVDED